MPHSKKVKSVVTRASKRKPQDKTTTVLPKKPRESGKEPTMQGRPELQITVPGDQAQGQTSPVQVILNQTVTTAPTQPSSLQPNGAVQGTVAWSPLLEPVTATSANWQQQPAPQHQFGWH